MLGSCGNLQTLLNGKQVTDLSTSQGLKSLVPISASSLTSTGTLSVSSYSTLSDYINVNNKINCYGLSTHWRTFLSSSRYLSKVIPSLILELIEWR
jgi:hypothetical protein